MKTVIVEFSGGILDGHSERAYVSQQWHHVPVTSVLVGERIVATYRQIIVSDEVIFYRWDPEALLHPGETARVFRLKLEPEDE